MGQAEAERQRQAEMVQTFFNEVRRLGTEQRNNLQEIQGLRAEQILTVPPVEPSGGADAPPPTIPAGRGIIDTRIGKPPVFSRDESTRSDWSFKLRSYVSVVDLQLGRMMEAAELAAHASVWIPSEPLNQDMDAQLRCLLVMLTSGPALQIIRQQPSGVQAFRDLARRYNPRSQARSLAQLQEIMHFDFGQEPAGVTDQMIVFERLVKEYETSSGEALGVQVKCAVLLDRVPLELRTHLLLPCGSRPDYAIEADSGKLLSGETVMAARPFNDNAKESTRVNTRTVLSLRAGHCGKWGRVIPPPPGLSVAGTAQSTTGTISTLESGWLCELVVGSDDARVRECEFVELLVDTGATEHVCGRHDSTHAALKNGPRPALKTTTGELLKHYGTRTAGVKAKNFECASQLSM